MVLRCRAGACWHRRRLDECLARSPSLALLLCREKKGVGERTRPPPRRRMVASRRVGASQSIAAHATCYSAAPSSVRGPRTSSRGGGETRGDLGGGAGGLYVTNLSPDLRGFGPRNRSYQPSATSCQNKARPQNSPPPCSQSTSSWYPHNYALLARGEPPPTLGRLAHGVPSRSVHSPLHNTLAPRVRSPTPFFRHTNRAKDGDRARHSSSRRR